MTRDLLSALAVLAAVAAWAVVVVVTVWRTGSVPAELWAAPGVVAGSILAAFRTTDRRRPPADDDATEDRR
jgi:hypothetical protein